MQVPNMTPKALPGELVFQGIVISGNQIGRTIGFRTANVAAPQAQPDHYGIYTTSVILEDGRKHHGISNLGVKPTIGSKEPLLEIHIFDFDEDIYGKQVFATLHEKLRPEQKFSSLEALKAQLSVDIQTGRRLMALQELAGSH